ncbi:MAG: DUF3054 domain-containing protein [Mycobacteriaceae bacterium]
MPTPERRAVIAAVIAAVIVDVALLCLFAATGRRSHAEGVTPAGIADTAWPFVAGAAVGWMLSRGWRRPTAVVPTGVTVWISTVAVGMLLRRVTGAGTAWSFVVVATVAAGLLILGWRIVAVGVSRRRRRSVP